MVFVRCLCGVYEVSCSAVWCCVYTSQMGGQCGRRHQIEGGPVSRLLTVLGRFSPFLSHCHPIIRSPAYLEPQSKCISFHTFISHFHFTLSFHTFISHFHFTLSFHTFISYFHFTLSFHTFISYFHFALSFHIVWNFTACGTMDSTNQNSIMNVWYYTIHSMPI